MPIYNEAGVKSKPFTPIQGNIFMAAGEAATRGQRLLLWMQENGYGEWGGQKRFSEATGIKQQQLSRYLNDEAEPTGDVRLRLAQVGINLHWLDTGIGPMNAPDPSKRVYPSELDSPGEFVGTMIMPDGTRYLVMPEDRPEGSTEQKPTDEPKGRKKKN